MLLALAGQGVLWVDAGRNAVVHPLVQLALLIPSFGPHHPHLQFVILGTLNLFSSLLGFWGSYHKVGVCGAGGRVQAQEGAV